MGEEISPFQALLQGNGVPYYSSWVREGMRRVGVADRLAESSEAVAGYVSLLAATLATGTGESNNKRHKVIAQFVNHVRGPMSSAVGSIYRGDCALYYSGFYLQRPSSSDLCGVAKESYATANDALSEATLIPGQFFRIMGENLEGLLEALASVSNEIVKPAITKEPFLLLARTKGFDPRMN